MTSVVGHHFELQRSAVLRQGRIGLDEKIESFFPNRPVDLGPRVDLLLEGHAFRGLIAQHTRWDRYRSCFILRSVASRQSRLAPARLRK